MGASIKIGKMHTEVFYEDDYPDFNVNMVVEMFVEVIPKRSCEAAMRLSKEHIGSKIAVMNFANAFLCWWWRNERNWNARRMSL